jgi:aminopeptidase YwaD
MGSGGKTGEINKSHVQGAFAFTDEVVEGFPARLVGRKSCHRAAERIKAEFHKNCDPGTSRLEEFTVHPQAFLKYIPGLVIVYFACVLLLFLNLPVIAFIGMALSMLVFVGEFVFYRELLDPFFPKVTGYNVHASIEPSAGVRQQVLVCAHHDAAYVFQILANAPRLYFPLMVACVLFLVLGLLVTLTAAVLSFFGIILPFWVPLALLIGGLFVLPFLFFTTGAVCPGAGDNMIAVAITAEIARLFGGAKKEGSSLLKHTRLVFVSFDGEECGIRGARAYVKKHRQELEKTKTWVLNMDTIYRLKELNFFDADLNSTVKLSRRVAEECCEIARGMGYRAAISRMSPGGGSTDAAAFGEAGIEATNICAMSFNVRDYDQGWVYHTPNDYSKHIEPEAVEAVLRVVREYILQKDNAI